ncbi:MAG TPA: hemerythrin domain-containing protein [Kofleriaceae bacterium]|nr:hemerythrin domain-containing protein [Kofleriaceae bacterium]
MPTKLLNDDGTASMATMIMTSHHAFHRDVACFAKALAETTRVVDVLREEWTRFRGALHGHHTVEDTGLFPDMRAKHPELAAAIDKLDEQHRAIDPLLERGDQVFADLANQRAAAQDVIASLAALLAEHLDAEEAAVIPHLRAAKQFPLPPSDDALAMYAEGFAWSTAGLASTVLEQVFAMLPPALVEKIPAARSAFDDRSRRVWGYTHTGASVTSSPA